MFVHNAHFSNFCPSEIIRSIEHEGVNVGVKRSMVNESASQVKHIFIHDSIEVVIESCSVGKIEIGIRVCVPRVLINVVNGNLISESSVVIRVVISSNGNDESGSIGMLVELSSYVSKWSLRQWFFRGQS